MKYQILFIAVTALFASCSNDKKATETPKHVSTLKSDILLESHANNPFNGPNNMEEKTLFITGDNILKGIATYKVTNKKGEELHCETFPAKQLIPAEYKTANSTLQEQHLKEVVKDYFNNEQHVSLAQQF